MNLQSRVTSQLANSLHPPSSLHPLLVVCHDYYVYDVGGVRVHNYQLVETRLVGGGGSR